MSKQNFIELWKKAKVLGDIDKALAQLSIMEMQELHNALEIAKSYVSITARDDCLLGSLRAEINIRARKEGRMCSECSRFEACRVISKDASQACGAFLWRGS